MAIRIRLAAPLLAAFLFSFLAGCGSDLESILQQSVTAMGQTLLDQLITDVANDLADRLDQDDADAADDGDDDGDDADGDDAATDGASFDELTGDAAAGEPLYVSCGGCHCPDASGDCVPGSPALVGASAEALDEWLRGDAAHIAADLTDQEIVDLEAFLASLGD